MNLPLFGITHSRYIHVYDPSGSLIEKVGPVGTGNDDNRLHWYPAYKHLLRANGGVMDLPIGELLCDSSVQTTNSQAGFMIPPHTKILGKGMPVVDNDPASLTYKSSSGGTILVAGSGFGENVERGALFLLSDVGHSNYQVMDLGLNGNFDGNINNVGSALRMGDTDVLQENIVLRNLMIHDPSGYCIGRETGSIRNALLENVTMIRAQSDAIDFKNRAVGDYDHGQNDFVRLFNCHAIDSNRQGQSGNAGYDLRGHGFIVVGCKYTSTGLALSDVACFSLRIGGPELGGDWAAIEEAQYGGRYSILANNIVDILVGDDDAGNTGHVSPRHNGFAIAGKSNVLIGNLARGCHRGFFFGYSAEDCVASGNIVQNCRYGIQMNGRRNKFVGAIADGILNNVADVLGSSAAVQIGDAGPDAYAQDCLVEFLSVTKADHVARVGSDTGGGGVADNEIIIRDWDGLDHLGGGTSTFLDSELGTRTTVRTGNSVYKQSALVPAIDGTPLVLTPMDVGRPVVADNQTSLANVTLPKCVKGMQLGPFINMDTTGLRLTCLASATDVIRSAAGVTPADGYVGTIAVGASLRLVGLEDEVTWLMVAVEGTWTLST